MSLGWTRPSQLPEFVDRRLRDARAHAQHGTHPHRGASDSVVSALSALLRDRGDSDRCRSVDRRHDPDLVRALRIYDEHGFVAAKIEAYLLTDLTWDQVAERVHESAQTIRLFAVCFFDVRSSLGRQQRRDILVAYCGVCAERRARDYLWKLVAVDEGAAALDTVLTRRDENSPDELLDQPSGALLDAIDRLFQSVMLWAGGRDREGQRIALTEFDDSAVELNLDETMVVGFEGELIHHDALFALTFPARPDDPLPSALRCLPVGSSPAEPSPIEPSPASSSGLEHQSPTEPYPVAAEATSREPPTWEALQRALAARRAAAQTRGTDTGTDQTSSE